MYCSFQEGTELICLIPELCKMTGLTDEMRKDFTVMKVTNICLMLCLRRPCSHIMSFICLVTIARLLQLTVDNSWSTYKNCTSLLIDNLQQDLQQVEVLTLPLICDTTTNLCLWSHAEVSSFTDLQRFFFWGGVRFNLKLLTRFSVLIWNDACVWHFFHILHCFGEILGGKQKLCTIDSQFQLSDFVA